MYLDMAKLSVSTWVDSLLWQFMILMLQKSFLVWKMQLEDQIRFRTDFGPLGNDKVSNLFLWYIWSELSNFHDFCM